MSTQNNTTFSVLERVHNLERVHKQIQKLTRPKWMDRFAVDLPEGHSGVWCVEKFHVNTLQSYATLNDVHPIPEGTYTRLLHATGDLDQLVEVVMSDTPAEIYQHLRFWQKAHGDVLVAGLGIGMIAKALCRKPDVKTITVVEQSSDVLHLNGAHTSDKLIYVHGDIHRYLQNENVLAACYDCCWLDIWPTISPQNCAEMDVLENLARRAVKANGVVMSWEREVCDLMRLLEALPDDVRPAENDPVVQAVIRYRDESNAIVAALEAGTL